MNEKTTDSSSENLQNLDLSSLSALDFNPTWAADGAKKISVDRSNRDEPRSGFDRRPSRREFSGAPRRDGERRGNPDRRGPRPPRRDNADGAGAQRPPRREFYSPRRRGDGDFHQPTRVVDIALFPEDKPFSVLAKAIKNSARTYVLFELANIILEKPERFVVVLSPLQKKDRAGKPLATNVPAQPFFISVPDGMPFLNEADALAHVFKNYLEKFFTIEDAEVEAPKGNWTMIAKCGFTGELLAPPNYHAYQQILRDHHAANFPKMAFEKFMSRIETSKEQEQIDAWVEKMKKVTRYVVKDRKEEEPEFLENSGAAKAFILANRKSQAVKETKQARFSGTLVAKMPMGPLKANIEHEIAFQQKFPLNTANGFRGRLRHLGFSLFKKGAKGITLVCGVKRKFRTPNSVFSETIQRVFDFLEKNPGANIKDLPKLMLGIEEKENVPAVEPENVPANENPPVPVADPENVPAEKVSEEKTVPVKNVADDGEAALLKELIGTVRWLVAEGYVSEMSDGKLFAHPVISEAQAKAIAKGEPPSAESKKSDLGAVSEALETQANDDEDPAVPQDVPAESPENVPAESPENAPAELTEAAVYQDVPAEDPEAPFSEKEA